MRSVLNSGKKGGKQELQSSGILKMMMETLFILSKMIGLWQNKNILTAYH